MPEIESRRMRAPRLAALAAAVALAGCEGANAFRSPLPTDGGGGAAEAPNVNILAPVALSAKPLGDSLEVVARVQDPGGVSEVVFTGTSRRGDPELGTEEIVTRFASKTAELNAATDTTVRRFLQATAENERDTAYIVVTATDLDGNVSADTVPMLLGGPDVTLLSLEDGINVTSGAPLSLEMAARDPSGLTVLRLLVTGPGAADSTLLEHAVSPVAVTDTFRTVYDIPAGAEGTITVAARAVNTAGVQGEDVVTLNAVEGDSSDPIPPTLQVSVVPVPRMELTDSTTVTVSGRDNDQGRGVALVGYTVVARSAHAGETVVTDSVTFAEARTGTVSRQFRVPIARTDPLALPDTLHYEVTAFMVDAAGNCAAAVSGSSEQLACTTRGDARVAAGPAGLAVDFEVLAGRTVQLPAGGRIMDAVVDTLRRNLFLSNLEQNQVEVFRLQTEAFLPPVAVGSEPWGLALNRPAGGGASDTLLVANSGGTNVTNVYLGGGDGLGPFQEDEARRFLMPDVVLFDIERTTDEFGALRLIPHPIPLNPPAFSDRPEFLAVDSTRTILLSTKETLLGDVGTIRKAFNVPGGRPEVVMFTEHGCCEPNANYTAVANVDSVVVVGSGSEVRLFDHRPGFPEDTLSEIDISPLLAASRLTDRGSDVAAYGNARFSVNGLGFSDTTYVSASGDGGFVVFGEGSVSPVGRIIMYNAATGRPSAVIPVTDLQINASETVRGVGLNYDGTLGVARGAGAYFFTTDLRLQGVAELPAGGAGAVLHPLHANARSLDNPGGEYRPDTHMAFLGTGAHTIDIVDTYHFRLMGRIHVRDVVSGPLRAVLPFPEDNEGLTCQSLPVTDRGGSVIGQAVQIFNGDYYAPFPPEGATPTEDACVVVKLFGITDSGGVVVVDVRKSDILRNHPSRQ